jgi:hypothetical protein
LLHDELADEGFTVMAVALDESADDVREFAEGITFPVLVDRDHVLAELYAVSNVPTVVWIDERGRIARPNSAEVGTDLFEEFTGITPDEHMEQVRRWVRTGALPDDADYTVEDLDPAEVEARLAFRLGAHLRRSGDDEGAARWFERAATLAPMDFTVRRAAMPLRGVDPFGERFLELFGDWQAAGSPYHGVPRGGG